AFAILLMVVYHFCYDLRFYHVAHWDFEHDPFWLAFRALVVTSFMLLVGVSLVLAQQAGISRAKLWKRILIIALCALIASAASYAIFPQSFIFFGVLHAIAVTSVLTWPLVRHPVAALAIGAIVIAAGLTLSHPLFDQRALAW